MKTLLLLLLGLCAPAGFAAAQDKTVGCGSRGMEAIDPIWEGVEASGLTHFEYRVDGCGQLISLHQWPIRGWHVCSAFVRSSDRYFSYSITDCPCLNSSGLSLRTKLEIEMLNWMATKPRLDAYYLQYIEPLTIRQ